MLLKFDLDGINVTLQIKNYRKASHDDWDTTWCKVDCSFVSEPWLQYQKTNDEIFLAQEIDDLADLFENLLTDQAKEPIKYPCMEPDFEFLLYPKHDIRDNPKVVYFKPGCEIVDIGAEWKVSFWHDGLTANYLSLYLDRKDIECLLAYFQLVSGRISMDAPVVRKLVEEGIILP